MRLRQFHLWCGVILSAGILLSAFTGTMRANATTLYWKSRPPRLEPVTLTRPAVEIAAVFDKLQSSGWQAGAVRQIELGAFLGRPVYRIESSNETDSLRMVDAGTGEMLSPLDLATARRAAALYVPEGTDIREENFLPDFLPRKAIRARPAYRFLFQDPAATEVFIDRDTGETLYVLDRGRRFGMWMIRLHELDFGGLHQPGLTFLGIGTILLTFSGLGMFVAMQIRKNRKKQEQA